VARSEGVGLGAEFEIVLPRGRPEDPEPRPSARSRPRSGLRLVVVEDNPDAREMLCALLSAWGHQVEASPDGVTGLERLLADPPDVALVDIGLPGIDGYQLAANVRTAERARHVRLVAVTGYGRPEDRGRAMLAGFDACLVKPVDPDDLEQVLARLAPAG
jgi:CheY-like chemotaxis protein